MPAAGALTALCWGFAIPVGDVEGAALAEGMLDDSGTLPFEDRLGVPIISRISFDADDSVGRGFSLPTEGLGDPIMLRRSFDADDSVGREFSLPTAGFGDPIMLRRSLEGDAGAVRC